MWVSTLRATAIDTFTQLKCNFNVCATDISTATSSAEREYILTIPETQMPASQVIQPAQQSQVATKGQQQQTRGQPTSFLVIDNQQAVPSRPLTFTLMLMKHPSVTPATGKESQHNISVLSTLFGNLQSVMSYQQINTPQPFSPADKPAPATSLPPPLLQSKNISSQ